MARLHHTDRSFSLTYEISYLILLHVTGQPSTEYVSEETPMTAYANLHVAFEGMRVRALDRANGNMHANDTAGTEPPRVLILGPENSGKTSIAKILINYATRAGQNWSPMLVNVDPGEVIIQHAASNYL